MTHHIQGTLKSMGWTALERMMMMKRRWFLQTPQGNDHMMIMMMMTSMIMTMMTSMVMISMMMIMTITMFRKAQPGTEHQDNAACPWEPSACRPSEAGLARKVILLVVMMVMMMVMA